MEVLEKINNIVKELDEIDEYFETLPNRQSEVDLKISDIYHYIENTTMNTKSSYRIVKELKEVLLKRRELKQEQSLLSIYDENKQRLLLKNNRTMLLANVNKENKNLHSKYKYRIYDESEFKEKMEK